jgi:hypothetical protein
MSAFSVSVWELTEKYSPAAINRAPATRPATVANTIGSQVELAAAIPIARLEMEIIPSIAPKTAALNKLLRCMQWGSK